jgi:hypothetical protein
MKKIYTLLLFLFFHSYFCQSQPPGGNDNNPVEVVKMAYITQELNLSPQEARDFWPVYNSYNNEIKQARNQYPNDEVAYERKVVEIKERYQGSFKKVLGNNNQRINKVYTTDKQFNNMLRTEQKNRQQQKQGQNFQQKQFQQPQQRNNGNKNNNVNKGNVKKPRPPR